MKTLSIESDRQALTGGDDASNVATLAAQFACGPPKPEKTDCCKFRSRIPHYIWTNRPLTCCQCSCTCGGAHWRTCERVGNFTVVLERSDPETYGGSEIILVVGPHWPFAITFTVTMLLVFPLTTLLIFWRTVPLWASYTILIVTCCTIASLAVLGCKNPGIAPRRVEKPSVGPAALQKWLWNDQASTWRGQNDSYSQEMNVVLQDVDHICPFTGTAIARRNMAWFITFQFCVIVLGFCIVGVVGWGLVLSASAVTLAESSPEDSSYNSTDSVVS